MATRALFRCDACSFASPKWFGRCPECGTWSSATEGVATDRAPAPVVTLHAAGASPPPRLSTGAAEVDRVLGGGLVPGAVVLLAGEPGIGKSTLVLQVLAGVAATHRVLLATGEESLAQVALRARRLGLDAGRVHALATGSLEAVLAAAVAEAPEVLVVDSVQTLSSDAADQVAGSTTQVRDCAGRLIRHAKEKGTAIVLIGHVTKDGTVAGPKTLEHAVDVVVALDGERSGTLRLLRAVKNRYGSTDETGVLIMGERGLEPVPDPSALLLADRAEGAAGSVVFPSLEGTRPVLVEVQALVCDAHTPQPRRVAIGVDARRVALLTGVLGSGRIVGLGEKDVFAAAAGGLAVREPAADLALAVALMSAASGTPVPSDIVAFGEVGLAGEIRRVPGSERRLAEAARLGFTRAVTARGAPAGAPIEVVEVADLTAARAAVLPA